MCETIRDTHILKPCYRLVYVAGRVFVQLLIVAEDDDGDVDGAQHGELMRLLEQAALALEEGDRPDERRSVSVCARDMVAK